MVQGASWTTRDETPLESESESEIGDVWPYGEEREMTMMTIGDDDDDDDVRWWWWCLTDSRPLH